MELIDSGMWPWLALKEAEIFPCIQVSQEADQMVWYSHLFQNFPQFIVIYTVKGLGIVNKVEPQSNNTSHLS